MSTNPGPKPQRRMRIDRKAALVPIARFQAWYDQTILTPGLNEIERGVLAAIATWYRQRQERGYAGSLSYDRLGQRLDVDPVNVRWAVEHLVELGLIAVKPGAGGRANTYLPALPRRIAALMLTAAVDDHDLEVIDLCDWILAA
jgi:hypothetical protein